MIRLRTLDPLASSTAILELWAEAIGAGFPLDERLYLQQLRMEKDELALIGAFDEEERRIGQALGGSSRLVGAALVKRGRGEGPVSEPSAIGNLSFILVARAWRRRGIGSVLLGATETWLGERGVKELRLGRDRNHFFPGLPLDGEPGSLALAAFLAAKGFRFGDVEEDLVADLGELELDDLAGRLKRQPDYGLAFYRPEHKKGLESFFADNFPGRWREDCFEALDSGMRGADLALLVEGPGGRITGFARLYDPDSPLLGPGVYWRALLGDSPGGLGPIGVDESKRGQGLGLWFLHACLVELKRRGVRKMVIDWTDLAGFYAKLGFRVWKRYRLAAKDLA